MLLRFFSALSFSSPAGPVPGIVRQLRSLVTVLVDRHAKPARIGDSIDPRTISERAPVAAESR